MRDETNLNMYCIKANNADEFNEMMKSFCLNHKVKNITPYPDFLAYIEYEEKETIFETRLELLESIERHTCGECPLLETPDDGRRKKLYCKLHNAIKWKDSPACEEYYLKGVLNEKHLPEFSECDEGERLVNC